MTFFFSVHHQPRGRVVRMYPNDTVCACACACACVCSFCVIQKVTSREKLTVSHRPDRRESTQPLLLTNCTQHRPSRVSSIIITASHRHTRNKAHEEQRQPPLLLSSNMIRPSTLFILLLWSTWFTASMGFVPHQIRMLLFSPTRSPPLVVDQHLLMIRGNRRRGYQSTMLFQKISKERRKQLGIQDDEDEYDLDYALDNNTDPLISKIIAGSLIVTILALLIAGVIIPYTTDYGEGVCNPILTGGRC